jgi:hypothetical protein
MPKIKSIIPPLFGLRPGSLLKKPKIKRETKKEMTIYTKILRVSMFEGTNIFEPSVYFKSF